MEYKKFHPYVKLIGAIASIFSISYLVRSFFKHSELIFSVFSAGKLSVVFSFGVTVYFCTLLIFAYTWKILLANNPKTVNFSEAFYIIGTSQIGKYLPGNVFHIASRFYLTQKLGIAVKPITNALFLETVFVIISAFVVGNIYFVLYDLPSFISELSLYSLYIGLCLVTVFIGLTVKKSDHCLSTISAYFLVMVIFTASHFLLGGILYFEQFIFYKDGISYLAITSILALSFVVGYVTPGSPGGVGIREFIFVKLAVNHIDEIAAMNLIICFRAISISGDLLMYFCSRLRKNKIDSTGNMIL